MGYAGGLTPDPTYVAIGDHTETVQVDYDPRRITYDDLLAVFWRSHDPYGRSWSRQYMNAVFYHDERQQKAALVSRAMLEKASGRTVRTEVLFVRTFTLAEDYHQKYLLKRHPDLSRELMRIYPDPHDFITSTAVSRVNGYVGGFGSRAQLLREGEGLGLSPETLNRLLKQIGNRSSQ